MAFVNDLLFKEESYQIVGAAMRVHKALGCGFIEKVYQDALEVEFLRQGIPFEREKHLTIEYDGVILPHDFYLDFLCFGKIVVELKAVSEVVPPLKAQLINYMRVGNFKLGYLLNFADTKLQQIRLINSYIL